MTGLRFFGSVHTGYPKNQGYALWRPMVDITADHSMVPKRTCKLLRHQWQSASRYLRSVETIVAQPMSNPAQPSQAQYQISS